MERLRSPWSGIRRRTGDRRQVLVFHDLAGHPRGPRGALRQRYADLLDAMTDGVRHFAEDVREGRFPAARPHLLDRSEEFAEFRKRLEAPTAGRTTS